MNQPIFNTQSFIFLGVCIALFLIVVSMQAFKLPQPTPRKTVIRRRKFSLNESHATTKRISDDLMPLQVGDSLVIEKSTLYWNTDPSVMISNISRKFKVKYSTHSKGRFITVTRTG